MNDIATMDLMTSIDTPRGGYRGVSRRKHSVLKPPTPRCSLELRGVASFIPFVADGGPG